MRIVQANAVYDPGAKTPNDLLDRYFTLTEWSGAVAGAGAEVSVVQRFHTAASIVRVGVRYEFVTDKQPPWLSTRGAPSVFASRDSKLVETDGFVQRVWHEWRIVHPCRPPTGELAHRLVVIDRDLAGFDPSLHRDAAKRLVVIQVVSASLDVGLCLHRRFLLRAR